jgi:GT2 family glycosyltransferase
MSASPETAAKPAVAIVLVNWNGWKDTVECVSSVLAHRYPDFHIFVVDNDSSDQSVERIAAWCEAPRADSAWRAPQGVDRATDREPIAPLACRIADCPVQVLPAAPAGCRLTVIRSGGNLGFAGGCNVGVRAAGLERFQYFWFLNTDTVVHRDALDALIERATREPAADMVGSTLRYYASPEILQAMGGARLNEATAASEHIGEGNTVAQISADATAVERELSYIFGASMLVSSRFIREVGLMQEDYFLYYEEVDWAMRGRGRFKPGYAPNSHVFHKSGASSSKVKPLFTSNLYYRNRIRFASRFLPHALHAVRRRMLWDACYYVLKGHWATARLVASILIHSRRIALEARAPASASAERHVAGSDPLLPVGPGSGQ